MIPEGGSNELAVKGVTEFAETLGDDFDYLCCAVGTGGTIAGLIEGLKGKKNIIGFPVLKGGEFLKDDIEKLLPFKHTNWQLQTDYHFGGYAKTNVHLNNFIQIIKEKHNLPLDHVYTAKLFWGVMKEIALGNFKKTSTILILHSGGLRQY
jgi:1-aminocyclopropane-1-carboxylate deaminase/D-cysteine desulfhydrase-like pyridoxal-dependent ACC family enzyme